MFFFILNHFPVVKLKFLWLLYVYLYFLFQVEGYLQDYSDFRSKTAIQSVRILTAVSVLFTSFFLNVNIDDMVQAQVVNIRH